MRSIPSRGGVVAVLLLASAMACGTQGRLDSQKITDLNAAGQALISTFTADDDDGDDSRNPGCDAILARLQKDAMKMQRTEEFQAVSETKEFKAVTADFHKMRAKKCSMNGANQSAECNKLRMQAFRHQQALIQTDEFDALSQTPEFKKVMKDAREAQEKDCLEGMGGAFWLVN